MWCRPSQRTRWQGGLKGPGGGRLRVNLSCHVERTRTNMYKYEDLSNETQLQLQLATSIAVGGKPQFLALCLCLRDAFITYSYLHCPMRHSRFGEPFVSDYLNLFLSF